MEEIEELAFKDRKELSNLNELDLLEIIEFLQLDRKQWINQYSTAHNDYVELKEIEKEHQRINGELRVENKELKGRIDKAVEYINGQKYFDCNYNPEAPWDWEQPKHDLLDLLKGDKE